MVGWDERDRKHVGYSAFSSSDLAFIPLAATRKLISFLLLGDRKYYILAMVGRKTSSPPHPLPFKCHRTVKRGPNFELENEVRKPKGGLLIGDD